MRRREFIAGLGGAIGTPAILHAQSAHPTIGFLHPHDPMTFAPLEAAFLQSLAESGYVTGQNVKIEYRGSVGRPDQLPAFAEDLVRHKVALIVTSTSAAALAAKAAAVSIPIVFEIGGDPVSLGLVKSLNRPGGNLTGITQLTGDLEAKRLELLREAVPNARVIGVLVNRNRLGVENQLRDVQEATRVVGQQVVVFDVRSERDLDNAFASFATESVSALLVGADSFLYGQRQRLVALAFRHGLPAVYQWRDYVTIGGLMSYGTNLRDAFRQLGHYAGRVLKGEKTADLPVVQSAKVELVINLKTAQALGLTFPITLLGRADEVIE